MLKFPPAKISTFLLVSQFIISLLGVGSICGFALVSIEQSGRQAAMRDVENVAYAIGNGLEELLAQNASANLPSPALAARVNASVQANLTLFPQAHFAVYDPEGNLITCDPPDDFQNLTAGKFPGEISSALVSGTGITLRTNSSGESILSAAARIDHGADVYGLIQLQTPFLPAIASTYNRMLAIGLLAAAIIAIMMAMSWQTSRRLSQPVAHLNQVAEKLSHGELSARAEQKGPLEFVRLAETLNRMAERLHASLNAMQTFVANASHELRTPLTSIKLEVGALRGGAMDEPEIANRFLDQMDGEIDRLVYTVNEMLDLSQIEGATQSGKFMPVDLVDLAYEVQAFWEARSQQAGLSLTLEKDANLPRIKGDAYQLRRLFDNLIDNAIKNTPEGGQVQILLRTDAALNRVRIEILDTGIGIDPRHFANIFDRFYRVNPTGGDLHAEPGAQRRSSGSGLGLAIARSIVVAHRGDIGVESNQGTGSIFWVSLPIWTE